MKTVGPILIDAPLLSEELLADHLTDIIRENFQEEFPGIIKRTFKVWITVEEVKPK